ncbi:hypothetical protein BM221_006796 [Beauveria bassiana]|uniref:Uncharacterized protein n=1 Tax=Beauveria bassiana TaxID=176275 RepID=A0A2N6NIR7_BEABA|nr:hypothetical protein BM221_006796 [Beauveria bassiana]
MAIISSYCSAPPGPQRSSDSSTGGIGTRSGTSTRMGRKKTSMLLPNRMVTDLSHGSRESRVAARLSGAKSEMRDDIWLR